MILKFTLISENVTGCVLYRSGSPRFLRGVEPKRNNFIGCGYTVSIFKPETHNKITKDSCLIKFIEQ